MVEVYLARHGQTEENVCRIFQGHLPGRLTDEGKLQAIALGEYLKDIPLDGILSSDLDRVVETVRLAVGSRHLPWQITPLLREINWGSWTGLPIDSVDKSCYPENAETREMLYHRAEQCVDFIRGNYQNTRLLVVAHGLINRSIRAVVCGIPVSELYTVSRIQNGECCRLEL